MRLRENLPAVAAVVALILLTSCSSNDQPAGGGDQKPTAEAFPGNLIAYGLPQDLPGFGVGTDPSEGFDVELAKIIVKGLGKSDSPTDLRAAERDDALLGTAGKRVQMVVSAYSILQSRLDEGIIFAGPYLKTGQAFLVRVDDPTKWSRESIVGKDICVTDGTTGQKAHFPPGRDPVVRPLLRDCVNALKAGSVDAVFDDEVILWGHQKDAPQTLKVVSIPSIGTEQYYGVGLPATNAVGCAKVSAIIRNFVDSVRWRMNFQTYVPTAAAHYDTDVEGFESVFKPTPDEIADYDCKTTIS